MKHDAIQNAVEKIIEPNWKNKTIFLGDNLHIMRRMNSSLMDLIATDPPFNSGRKYRAPIGDADELKVVFEDYWHEEDLDQLEHALLAQYKDEMEMDDLSLSSRSRHKDFNPLYSIITSSRAAHGKGMFTYLIMMAMRLIECRRLLKDTGSIYLHCDHSASHYLKMVMDAIFGKQNFRNEIIWCYGGRGMAKRWFQKKHDTILFYSKTDKYFFNRIGASRPVAAEHVGRYNKTDEEGKKYARVKNKDGSYSNIYLKEEGVVREDWWQIPFVRGDEYTGYETQKPLKLYERIIKASSNPGDRVFDPFCGCATTLVAAEKLGREWVGIDLAVRAKAEIKERMMKLAVDRGENELAIWKSIIPPIDLKKSLVGLRRTDLGKLPHPRTHKNWLYGEDEHCAGCGVQFPKRNMTIDHIVPKSKGGTDHRSNLQLLCGACNSMKGDRPQAYLEKQLKRLGIILD